MKLVAIAVACVCACAKQSPQGLPPAQEWKPVDGPAVHGSNRARTEQPPDDEVHRNAQHPAPAAKTLEKLAGDRFALGPYSIAVPAGWTEVATASEMRAGQFKIGADAELVIYYFGPNGAGSHQDNIDRWTGQFSRDDGKPLAPAIENTKLLGHDAVLVRVTGHYRAMAMPGTDAVDKPAQSMLAAITGSPSGPYYWKLVGSQATVHAHRRAFEDLLKGMKLK